MNAISPDVKSGQPPTSLDPFVAVIVYETGAALQRTIPIFQRLIQEFAADTEFKCVWVSFENLSTESVASDAARNAIKADMVIFSAETNELPQKVRGWIEAWLPRKNFSHSALVALIGASADQSDTTSTHRYLEKVAKRGAMNFLCKATHNATAESPEIVSGIIWNPAAVPNHWGINE